jgi:hypothetical protein
MVAPALALRWKTIRHLDRLGCALSSAFGVRTSSSADDDLDAAVCAQPIGEDLGNAVVEQSMADAFLD